MKFFFSFFHLPTCLAANSTHLHGCGLLCSGRHYFYKKCLEVSQALAFSMTLQDKEVPDLSYVLHIIILLPGKSENQMVYLLHVLTFSAKHKNISSMVRVCEQTIPTG
jgi:hypothetical protein